MKLEYIKAEEYRNQWARECGCKDFVDAMKQGLVRVGKCHPAYLAANGRPLPIPVVEGEPAKEITDAAN